MTPASVRRVSIDLRHRLARRGMELGRRLAQNFHEVASSLASGWPRRSSPPHTAPPTPPRLSSILRRAEASLADNVLPFWARHAPDEEYGGFITHLDRTGGRVGPTHKYLVFQARMIWTLAAAHRFGFSDRRYAEAAGLGVRFLTDRMWDGTHGGFLWTVTRDGSRLNNEKRLYGQAFAIYALAEYGMAARDERALNWAERTLDVLLDKAADGPFGFREVSARDWAPARSPAGQDKTLDAHLHLLEALTTLAAASRSPRHAAILAQVVDLLVARAIDPRHGFARETFDRAWRPKSTSRQPARASYGHEVEMAWMLLDATDALDGPRDRVRKPVLGLIAHALNYGFDHARGGLAFYGPPVGSVRRAVYLPASRLAKVWWPQAEMLVATLEAYRWIGDARYAAAFEKQFEWIWRHQIDHVGGDWYEATTWREGRPLQSHKGHEWKDPYHNARALMKISRGLRALGVLPD